MSALPIVNPYESPFGPAEAPREGVESSGWLPLALRLLAYALCGIGLFVAYCTPLCPARQFFFRASGEVIWHSLACMVVSSVITGLLLDVLVRGEWHCVLVALLWAQLTAVAFALSLFIAFDGWDIVTHPESIPLIATLSLSYGTVYGAICLHLSLPISTLCVWLARQATAKCG